MWYVKQTKVQLDDVEANLHCLAPFESLKGSSIHSLKAVYPSQFPHFSNESAKPRKGKCISPYCCLAEAETGSG